jgi:hypothetical protein
MPKDSAPINKRFRATLQKSPAKGGWTIEDDQSLPRLNYELANLQLVLINAPANFGFLVHWRTVRPAIMDLK